MDVKRLREKLGLSQAEFAFAVGVSANTVYRWERGQRPRSRAILDRIEELGWYGERDVADLRLRIGIERAGNHVNEAMAEAEREYMDALRGSERYAEAGKEQRRKLEEEAAAAFAVAKRNAEKRWLNRPGS